MSLNKELKDDPLAFAKKYSILGHNDAARAPVQLGKIGDYNFSKMKGLTKIAHLDCVKMKYAAELMGRPTAEQIDFMVNEGADTVYITPYATNSGDLVPDTWLDSSGSSSSCRCVIRWNNAYRNPASY